MPFNITWPDIALRLLLTCIAALIIGFDRERGRPAGMGTTMLVALAAALAMISANLLLHTTGKAADSFVVLDVERLPLGILSGMGFIGAGTILRRGNLVVGVTTAATLWFATVMGLCFGAGQLVLGGIAAVLGILILRGLKVVEDRMRSAARGALSCDVIPGGPSDDAIHAALRSAGFHLLIWEVIYLPSPAARRIRCELQWQRDRDAPLIPPAIAALRDDPAIGRLRWREQTRHAAI